MKKLVYVTMLLFCVSIVMVSCKESKEKEVETESSLAAEKAEMAMNDVFQCPMDCEKGKTYEKEGTCPICKMDLKKVEKAEGEHEEAHDEHAGHDHD